MVIHQNYIVEITAIIYSNHCGVESIVIFWGGVFMTNVCTQMMTLVISPSHVPVPQFYSQSSLHIQTQQSNLAATQAVVILFTISEIRQISTGLRISADCCSFWGDEGSKAQKCYLSIKGSPLLEWSPIGYFLVSNITCQKKNGSQAFQRVLGVCFDIYFLQKIFLFPIIVLCLLMWASESPLQLLWDIFLMNNK